MTPVTTPVAGITVATELFLLLQKPPDGPPLASDVDEPGQALVVPVIAPGKLITWTVAVLWQPVGKRYLMVVVPGIMPEILPESGCAVATERLLLLHTPPLIISVKTVLAPIHTAAEPFIVPALGNPPAYNSFIPGVASL